MSNFRGCFAFIALKTALGTCCDALRRRSLLRVFHAWPELPKAGAKVENGIERSPAERMLRIMCVREHVRVRALFAAGSRLLMPRRQSVAGPHMCRACLMRRTCHLQLLQKTLPKAKNSSQGKLVPSLAVGATEQHQRRPARDAHGVSTVVVAALTRLI